MIFQCRDGKRETDPTWHAQWNSLFYGANEQILKAQSWCEDHAEMPKRLPTKKGLRRFLGNWIRRSCLMKPSEAMRQAPEPLPAIQPLEARRAHLAALKAMVQK